MVCFVWAGNFIISAWAVQFLEPVTYTVVRFALVLALIFPLLRRPAAGQWLGLVITCWFVGALHFAFLFMALGRSSDVSSVALLMQVYIPISTILAVVFLGERIGWRTTSGIALSFTGVLVMGFDPLILAQLDVMLLVLLSALSLAAGTVMMRRLKGVSAMNFQAWNALFAFPLLFLLAFWNSQRFGSRWHFHPLAPLSLAMEPFIGWFSDTKSTLYCPCCCRSPSWRW